MAILCCQKLGQPKKYWIWNEWLKPTVNQWAHCTIWEIIAQLSWSILFSLYEHHWFVVGNDFSETWFLPWRWVNWKAHFLVIPKIFRIKNQIYVIYLVDFLTLDFDSSRNSSNFFLFSTITNNHFSIFLSARGDKVNFLLMHETPSSCI